MPIANSTSMVSDLNSATPPDFVWYTPNLIDDQHDGTPAQADAFMSSFIPSVQATNWYKAGGQIVIEWDEALASDTSGLNGGSGGHVRDHRRVGGTEGESPTGLHAGGYRRDPPLDRGRLRPVVPRWKQSGWEHRLVAELRDDDTAAPDHHDNHDHLATVATTTTSTPRPPVTTTTTPPKPPTTTTTPPVPPATTTTTSTPRPPTTTTTAPPRPPTTTTTTPPAPTTTTTTPAPSSPPPPTGPPVTTSVSIAVVPEVGLSVQRLTASVSPAPGGGTVQFTVDGWVVGDAVPLSSDGTAVIALYMTNGSHAIDATYSGDVDSASSSAATVVGVGQALTTLTVSDPTQIGSTQLPLSADLSSEGTPVVGAPIWFSAEGSALCVATTDATGQASCSIDEGTSDLFALATQGVAPPRRGRHAPSGDESLPELRRQRHGGHRRRAIGLHRTAELAARRRSGRQCLTSGVAGIGRCDGHPGHPGRSADAILPGSGSGSGAPDGLFLLVGLLGLALVGVDIRSPSAPTGTPRRPPRAHDALRRVDSEARRRPFHRCAAMAHASVKHRITASAAHTRNQYAERTDPWSYRVAGTRFESRPNRTYVAANQMGTRWPSATPAVVGGRPTIGQPEQHDEHENGQHSGEIGEIPARGPTVRHGPWLRPGLDRRGGTGLDAGARRAPGAAPRRRGAGSPNTSGRRW